MTCNYIDDKMSEYAMIETQTLSNGYHEIKAVTIDSNGLVTISPKVTVDFNNTLYCVTMNDDFEPNKDYSISAISNSPNEFRVKLVDWDGIVVWTSSPSSGGLNTSIPSSALTGPIYDLKAERGIPGGWEPYWGKGIARKDPPNDAYKFAIFLPNVRGLYGEACHDTRKEAVAEIVRRCEQRNMKYIILYKGRCNWENFSTVLSYTSVSYVYMVTHGGKTVKYGTQSFDRYNFYVKKWSGLKDDMVVSHSDGLPEGMNVHSMRSLGLYQSRQIRLVYITACILGESQEMAEQWMDWSMGSPINQDFCGWNTRINLDDIYFHEWDYDFWHYWCEGNDDVYWVIGWISRSAENQHGLEILDQFEEIGDESVTFTSQGNP